MAVESRSRQWGTILIVTGCLLVPALVFYGFSSHKTAYYSGRYSRLAGLLADQVRGSVDHLAITLHNVDQPKGAKNPDDPYPYLKQVGIMVKPNNVASLKENAGADSAEIRWEGGVAYLDVSYPSKGSKQGYIGEQKVLDLVKSYWNDTNFDFDEIILADETGQVLLQRSRSGLRMSNVRASLDSKPKEEVSVTEALTSSFEMIQGALFKKDGAKPETAPPSKPATPSSKAVQNGALDVSTLRDVEFGGRKYKAFLQPVPLSVKAGGDEGKSKYAQWIVLCAVSAERFNSEVLAFPYQYLRIFLFLALMVPFSLPFIRLATLDAREDFRLSHVGFMTASGVGIVSLLTLVLCVAYYESVWQTDQVDVELKRIASQFSERFSEEVSRLALALDTLEKRPEFKDQKNPAEQDGVLSKWMPFGDLCPGDPPPRDCIYPDFELAFWLDKNGTQKVKWTGHRAEERTPLVPANNVPFYQDYRHGKLGYLPGSNFYFILEPTVSPTTGENVAVFGVRPAASDAELTGFLVAKPLPLYGDKGEGVMMPQGYGFAVIDQPSGVVLFHSRPSRNQHERFYSEADENKELRSASYSPRAGFVSGVYEGRNHRFYVTPVTTIQNLPWRLIVFHDTTQLHATFMQVSSAASILFLFYFLFCLLFAAVIYLGKKQLHPHNWVSPPAEQDIVRIQEFLRIRYLYLLAVLVYLIWVSSPDPLDALFGGALLVFAAAATGFERVKFAILAKPIGLIAVDPALTIVAGFGLGGFLWWIHGQLLGREYDVLIPCLATGALFSAALWSLQGNRKALSRAVPGAALLFMLSRLLGYCMPGSTATLSDFFQVSTLGLIALVSGWYFSGGVEDRMPLAGQADAAFMHCAFLLVILQAILPMVSCFRIAYAFESSLAYRLRVYSDREQWMERAARIRSGNIETYPGQTKKQRADWLELDYTPSVTEPPQTTPDEQQALFSHLDLDNELPIGRKLAVDLLRNVTLLYSESTSATRAMAFRKTSDGSAQFDKDVFHRPNEVTLHTPNYWREPGEKFDDLDVQLNELGLKAPGLLFLATAGLALCGLYGVTRWLTRSVFALDLSAPMDSKGKSTGAARNTLLLGPPGSGKSEALEAYKPERILDWLKPPAEWPLDAPGANLLSEGTTVAIDHFESMLHLREAALKKLEILEDLVLRQRLRVVIASSVDPIFYFESMRSRTVSAEAESGQDGLDIGAPELARWAAVLQSFETVVPPVPSKDVFEAAARVVHELCTGRKSTWTEGGFTEDHLTCAIDPICRSRICGVFQRECSVSPPLQQIGSDLVQALGPQGLEGLSEERLLTEIGLRAEAHYQNQWGNLCWDEKLALTDPARDGLLNPKAHDVSRQLLRKGLLKLRPTRVMNETFRTYVLTGHRRTECAQEEHKAARESGSHTATVVAMVVWLSLTAFLLTTQRDLFESAAGYFSAIAAGLSLIGRLFRVPFLRSPAKALTE